METFRLVLSIFAKQAWKIAQIDIAAASLQARGFSREVFFKLQKEESDLTVLRRFTAAAYRLAHSDWLWYLTSNAAFTSTFGLARSKFESTLYFKNHLKIKHLDLLVVTQVDNYLYCGSPQTVTFLESFLQKKFDVGELDRRSFMALGCEVDQVKNRTVIVLQSAKTSSIDMAYLQANKQSKGDM